MKSKLLTVAVLFTVSLVLFAFVPKQQDPWKIPAKYLKMENPTKANPENIAIGKSLYKKHCKSCHGNKGLGDGPKAENLEAIIIGFDSKEYKTQKDGEKYFKSFIGRDEMPNFEKKISDDEDRWFLINYMETL